MRREGFGGFGKQGKWFVSAEIPRLRVFFFLFFPLLSGALAKFFFRVGELWDFTDLAVRGGRVTKWLPCLGTWVKPGLCNRAVNRVTGL